VDERGRVRLPSAFLAIMREQYGEELFVTSLDGRHLRVYPLKSWLKLEERLMTVPSMTPARGKLMDRVTFFGQLAKLDKVGRVLIPQRLRQSANLDGEVVVLGFLDYLEVWNPQDFMEKLERDQLTEDDKRVLSELGI
jgi:MraZ protein